MMIIEVNLMPGRGQSDPDRPVGRGDARNAQAALTTPAARSMFWVSRRSASSIRISTFTCRKGPCPRMGLRPGDPGDCADFGVYGTADPPRRGDDRRNHRGRVLPVGGVREKALAARRAGIGTLSCREEQRDLLDIPKHLRRDVKFILVDRIEEVLEAALRPPSDDPEEFKCNQSLLFYRSYDPRKREWERGRSVKIPGLRGGRLLGASRCRNRGDPVVCQCRLRHGRPQPDGAGQQRGRNHRDTDRRRRPARPAPGRHGGQSMAARRHLPATAVTRWPVTSWARALPVRVISLCRAQSRPWLRLFEGRGTGGVNWRLVGGSAGRRTGRGGGDSRGRQAAGCWLCATTAAMAATTTATSICAWMTIPNPSRSW